ncbi:MAG: triose-phosphate isomerase [Thermodesulfobacteriota bacterium]
MRRPLIAGNWKMHLAIPAARALAAAVGKAAEGVGDRDVLIAPPFTMLAAVREAAGNRVLLAGQNVCWEEQGAFTGEIAPGMLREVGCTMAIVGHSERRQIFGETNGLVNRRVAGAIKFGLVPILCIGETLNEREAGAAFAVLETQLKEGLAGIDVAGAEQLVIAYEPVWAIGTGKTATAEQAQEVHAFVRQTLASLFEKNIAGQMRILYGGSVNPANVDELMRQADVDGALVGGAALKAESFERIIHFQ